MKYVVDEPVLKEEVHIFTNFFPAFLIIFLEFDYPVYEAVMAFFVLGEAGITGFLEIYLFIDKIMLGIMYQGEEDIRNIDITLFLMDNSFELVDYLKKLFPVLINGFYSYLILFFPYKGFG